MPTTERQRPTVRPGQTWRRKRDGALVIVESVIDVGSALNPYLDIRWKSAKRRGACFEDFWLRDYEPVTDESSEADTGRVAVIGDVGGHLWPMADLLTGLGAELGMDGAVHLPAGLTVVQVGDLVHRGPDSDGVVAMVGQIMRDQPGQWIQLAGNHEAQYLAPPRFEWHESISDDSAETLRRWWSTGQMKVSASIRTPTGEFLATHAGLTEGFWRQILDEPATSAQAADRLNDLAASGSNLVYRAGEMLIGEVDLAAGPLWASAYHELVPSWLPAVAPFHQVHGHSTMVNWQSRRPWGRALPTNVELDFAKRHSVASVPGGKIIVGIDPGNGRKPHPGWAPLVFPGAAVEADERRRAARREEG